MDFMQFLIEKGADVNLADNKGLTSLHMAGRRGTKEIVILLLDNGANAGAADSQGKTALDYCEGSQRLSEIAEILRAAGP